MQLYIHKQHCNLKTTLAIDLRTGRVSTSSVLQAKNEAPITEWKVDMRIGWKKKKKKSKTSRGRLAQRESVCFLNIFFEGPKFNSAHGMFSP